AFAGVLDLPLPRGRLLGGKLSELISEHTLHVDSRLRALCLDAGRQTPGGARARPILNHEGRRRGQHDHDYTQNDPPQHDGMTPAQQTETMKAMMTLEAQSDDVRSLQGDAGWRRESSSSSRHDPASLRVFILNPAMHQGQAAPSGR